MSGKRPIHEVRIGNISATIWDNESNGQTWYNTVIGRSWKKGDEWQTTPDFRASDLPVVMAVAQAALQWILAQHHDRDGSSPSQ